MRKNGKIVDPRGSFGVRDILRVIFLNLCVKIMREIPGIRALTIIDD